MHLCVFIEYYVNFDGNWLAYLENLFQISLLQSDNYNLYIPKFVKKVVIDPTKQQVQTGDNGNNLINFQHFKN